MRVDLGKVLQEKQPKHVGSKAQTLEISHCQCREAGEDVKWRVFSMSLEGRGCGAHPASPEVVQRLQAGERSESVCVSPSPHSGNAFPKNYVLTCGACTVACIGMGMFQPLPCSPCPGHISWKGSSTRSSRTETATPWNSACCLFTGIPRGAQEQMAEAKHRERQLKRCWKGAGTKWLGLLNL